MLHPTDDYITLKQGMCKTAVVLAGGVRKDDTLPLQVKDRCNVAIDLFATGVIRHILCSGGTAGTKLTEAEAMKNYIAENGVPKRSISIEIKSRDTIGNAVFTKPLLTKQKMFVLITSDFHLSRAKSLFKHIYGENFTILGVASRSSPYHRFKRIFQDDAIHVVESTILSTVKLGDHMHAKKLMKKFIDRY